MSVMSYNELRAQLKRFTRRNDIDDVFDTMVEMVENEIYAGKTPLRVIEMVTTARDDCAFDDRTMPLPDYYLEMIKVEAELNADYTQELRSMSVDSMPSNVLAGFPMAYCIRDSKLVFDALPDTNYWINFTYFRRLAKLTEAAPTNTILTNYPKIYFYGLQAEIFDYAGEPDIAQAKRQAFYADIAGANHRYNMAAFGASVKLAGVQPLSEYGALKYGKNITI